MKIIKIRCFIVTLLVSLAFSGTAQNVSPYDAYIRKNFIREWSPTAPITDPGQVVVRPVEEVKQTTAYFDGLGRPLQTVTKRISPLRRDMVTTNVYDEYGREVYKFLPSVSTQTSGGNEVTDDGELKLNPFQQQDIFMNSFYASQGDYYYYSKQLFEVSPLDRVIKQMPQGNSWVGSNRGTTIETTTNTSADNVRIWTIADANASKPATAVPYDEGTLLKTISTDEHGNKVIEYNDKLGKIILKKVQLSNSPSAAHDGWLNTYYIYDAFENLRFVIQPQAVKLMLEAGNWNISDQMRDELCFYYTYDEENHMIIKKVPGAAEVYMVYDARDRLVMTQDGNMRVAGNWLVTTYTDLNQPLTKGILTDPNTSFATHRTNAVTSISYPSTSSNFELLTQNYYNDYSWVSSTGTSLNTSINLTGISNNFINSYNVTPYFALPLTQAASTWGLVTGTKVKVLNSNNQYLYAVTFYDYKGKPIQVQSINVTGGKDVTTEQYDFSSKPLRIMVQHEKGGTNPQTHSVFTAMEYDHAGRLLTIKKTVSSTVNNNNIYIPEKTILQNTYNELGQLKTKKIGKDPNSDNELESLNYDYNIRGWMLGTNRSYAASSSGNYFGFELGYDKPAGIGGNYVNPDYNGNISGASWRSKGDGELRRYDFTYDNVSRITGADFNQFTGGSFNKTANVDFSVSGLDYDANGNIQHMNQKGLLINTSNYIDQLTYNYINSSNKLLNVIDASNDASTKLGDFRASSLYQSTVPVKDASTNDYTYDVNGNMVKDFNKDIGTSFANGIAYNHLNLPMHIEVANKGSIDFVCDANGTKLKKIVHETNKPDKTTIYVGGFVYEDDVLQFCSHEEGRIRFKPAVGNAQPTFFYDYFLKDHLGNVRMVLTEEQQTDLYPPASMEDASIALEETYYANLQTTQTGVPFNYPANTPSGNQKVARVSGGTGSDDHKIGPSIVLKVMAGDKFNVTVNSWYALYNSTPQSPNSALNALLEALNSGVGNMAGGKVTQQQLATAGAFIPGVGQFLSSQNSGANTSKPRAFLNWLLFDEQFNLVASNSGFDQVGGDQEYKTHVQSNMPINKNGFLYIYVSNETPNINVYFDNLQVTHIRGPILEETHYYPFGLTMAGISSRAGGTMTNKDKTFQGQKFDDDFDVDYDEFKWRNDDPQIGRFIEIDPLSEDYEYNSTYAFSENKVTAHIELEGLESWYSQLWTAIVQTGEEIGTAALGVVGGAANTLTGGLVPSDLGIRNSLPPWLQSWYDNAVTVGHAAALVPHPGEMAPEMPTSTEPVPAEPTPPSTPPSTTPAEPPVTTPAKVESNSNGTSTSSGRGMQNAKTKAAVKDGNAQHSALKQKVNAKPGWKSEPQKVDATNGQILKPDVETPSGNLIELKPKTTSGIKQGKIQQKKYQNGTGQKTRVVYYKPKNS